MNSIRFWRDADKRFYVAQRTDAFTGGKSITPNSLSIIRDLCGRTPGSKSILAYAIRVKNENYNRSKRRTGRAFRPFRRLINVIVYDVYA